MNNILLKEFRLSASALTYPFVLFGFMFLIPGYPILCGVFFVTLGIFQSFQNARETNDILFSALLPISKSDVVKGKYIFVCAMELSAAFLMGLCVALRMTVLADSAVYRENALMNANLFALGFAFFIFGLFNFIFVGGFFKTAYKFGAPFFVYAVAAFIAVGIAEALHHFPHLEFLNAFGTENLPSQIILLSGGIASFCALSLISYKKSVKRFEKIDL